MPNYCENEITISHPDEDVMRPLMESIKEERMCAYVLPIPPCPDNDLFKKNAWEYDFCLNAWGTKWDIGNVKIVESTSTSITFDCLTAWSPPDHIFKILSKRGFKVRAYYFEPGCNILGKYESDTGFSDYDFDNKDDLLKQMSKEVYDKFQDLFDLEGCYDFDEESYLDEMWKEEKKQNDVVSNQSDVDICSSIDSLVKDYLAKKTYVQENYG